MPERDSLDPLESVRQLVGGLAGGRRAILLAAGERPGGDAAVLIGQDDEPAQVLRVPLAVPLGGAGPLREWLDAADVGEIELAALVAPFGRDPARASRHDMSEIAALNLTRGVPGGCDVLLVLPRGVLAGGRWAASLHELVNGRHIRAIIDLPGPAVFNGVHPTFRVGLLYLSAAPCDTAAVVSAENLDLPAVGLQVNKLWAGGRRTSSGFSVPTANLDLAAGVLPAQLDPDRQRRFAEASAIGDFREVKELFEVFQGARPTLRPRSDPNAGDVPMVSARHVRSGVLSTADQPEWCAPEESRALEAGDLVIRSIGVPLGPVVVAEVASEDLPLVAGRNVIVLRPRLHMGRSELRVLRGFLGSNRFALQLRSHQTGSPHLRANELAAAKVPLPDLDLQAAFQAVDAASEAFGTWAAECRDLLDMSFDADDLGEARTQLLAATGRLRQRATAARLLDDLGHRVASRFPLPIAYRWRAALAARGSSEELKAILRTQEVLVAYLATMALVSARNGDVEIGYLKDLRSRLGKARGGISLGDWRGVLAEVADSRSFRRLSDTHPLVEVRGYFRDPRVVQASDRLTSIRNDEAHLRESGPGNRDAMVEGAWQELETMVAAGEWLTEYPLIRVTETRWDAIDRSNRISFRELAGDSPVVPQSEMVSERNDVEAGSLYVRTGRGELVLLRPLVLGEDCPLCGHWSTFLPDRLSADGSVEYKSLEHGHPIAPPESATRALATVGLLEA